MEQAKADVIDKAEDRQKFRDAMDKLGLGSAAMARANPRLVYCSCKGFLPGPYEHRVALDEVMREAHAQGTVLCGYSAGSMCWFEWGVSRGVGTPVANPGLGLLAVTSPDRLHRDWSQARAARWPSPWLWPWLLARTKAAEPDLPPPSP